MSNLKVVLKKKYDKVSHTKDKKRGFAPVYSVGVFKKKTFAVTIHMTPELKKHPKERRTLLRHEKREANLLAKGNSVNYSHRKAKAKDPKYLKGKNATKNMWEKLGFGVR